MCEKDEETAYVQLPGSYGEGESARLVSLEPGETVVVTHSESPAPRRVPLVKVTLYGRRDEPIVSYNVGHPNDLRASLDGREVWSFEVEWLA